MENSAKYNEALYKTAKRTLRLSLVTVPIGMNSNAQCFLSPESYIFIGAASSTARINKIVTSSNEVSEISSMGSKP